MVKVDTEGRTIIDALNQRQDPNSIQEHPLSSLPEPKKRGFWAWLRGEGDENSIENHPHNGINDIDTEN